MYLYAQIHVSIHETKFEHIFTTPLRYIQANRNQETEFKIHNLTLY